MVKRIAVSPGLTNIKDTLKDHGYDVVGVDETGVIISAMIYSTKGSDAHNSPHNFDRYPDISNNEYVLLINADEKTPKEIIDLIEQNG